jgi:hypothetical protein
LLKVALKAINPTTNQIGNQTTQWPKEKGYQDKQNITQKTKDRATRTTLKTRVLLHTSKKGRLQ